LVKLYNEVPLVECINCDVIVFLYSTLVNFGCLKVQIKLDWIN